MSLLCCPVLNSVERKCKPNLLCFTKTKTQGTSKNTICFIFQFSSKAAQALEQEKKGKFSSVWFQCNTLCATRLFYRNLVPCVKLLRLILMFYFYSKINIKTKAKSEMELTLNSDFFFFHFILWQYFVLFQTDHANKVTPRSHQLFCIWTTQKQKVNKLRSCQT